MGLDQYAYTRKTKPEREVDFEEEDATIHAAYEAWSASNYDESKAPYLHYWRKHPNLHGWMEKLYREKGGAGPQDFNGEPVLLTLEDLARLEQCLLIHDLPHTEGFFFGATSDNGREELEDDLEFIKKARNAISEGKYVYYTSSW